MDQTASRLRGNDRRCIQNDFHTPHAFSPLPGTGQKRVVFQTNSAGILLDPFFLCNFTTIDGQRCSEMWDDHQRCFVFCYSVQMMPSCGFNGCRDANLHSFCSLLSDMFLTGATFQTSTEVEPLIIGLDPEPKELQLQILSDG